MESVNFQVSTTPQTAKSTNKIRNRMKVAEEIAEESKSKISKLKNIKLEKVRFTLKELC